MKIFIKISDTLYLNKLKEMLLNHNEDDFSDSDKEYLSKIKGQNPFGQIVMLLGLISFTLGPTYILLPIITISLYILTIGTFNHEKEDNPWVFHIGLCLAVLGLCLKIMGYQHHI